MTDRMSEALVPADAPTDVARVERAEPAELVLPQMIVDAGPEAVERFLEFFAARIANARTRAAYGRPQPQGDRSTARRRLHPDAPRVGADREAAPSRDPDALRLARRQPGPPREPGGRGAGTEARRDQGRDAGPLAG